MHHGVSYILASTFATGISRIARYGKEGSVLTVDFWIEDLRFVALNADPLFKFNEAESFIVNCDTQPEIDYYWEELSEGGDPAAQQCGWLKDCPGKLCQLFYQN